MTGTPGHGRLPAGAPLRRLPNRPCPLLRVATLNIWGRTADWSARLEILRERWPRVRADVLVLQEVEREGAACQATGVADALGMHVAATVDGHSHEHVDEGLALLAGLPVERVFSVPLPPSTPPRRALVAELRVGGVTVTVVNAHAVAVPAAARQAQIETLLSRPESPLVIGGDLNVTPTELDRLLAESDVVDPLADRGAATTWPLSGALFAEMWAARTGMPPHFRLDPKRIDYVLTRGIEVTAAGIDPLAGSDGSFASDHALVWADCVPAGVSSAEREVVSTVVRA